MFGVSKSRFHLRCFLGGKRALCVQEETNRLRILREINKVLLNQPVSLLSLSVGQFKNRKRSVSTGVYSPGLLFEDVKYSNSQLTASQALLPPEIILFSSVKRDNQIK